MKKNILFFSLSITVLLIFNSPFSSSTSSEPNLSSSQVLMDTLSKGEILFLTYCTSCHNPNLRENSTGPALGNITKFRSQEYLINITKDSQREIKNGNKIFTCLYYSYHQSVMTSFDFLTDDEIIELYDFIEKESIAQNISDDEVEYIMSCHKEGKERTIYVGKEEKRKTIFINQFEKPITNIQSNSPLPEKIKRRRAAFGSYFEKRDTISPFFNFDDYNIINTDRLKIFLKNGKKRFFKVFIFDKNAKERDFFSYYHREYFYGNIQNQGNLNPEMYIFKEIKNPVLVAIEYTSNTSVLFGMKKVTFENLNQTHEIEVKLTKNTEIKGLLYE